MSYFFILVLVIVSYAAAFYAGARYGLSRINADLKHLMADLDAQLDHLGVRVGQEAREHAALIVAYIKAKLGIK